MRCVIGSLCDDLDDRPQKWEKLFGVLFEATGKRDRLQATSTFGLYVTEGARELQCLTRSLGFLGEKRRTRAALLERFGDYFRVSSPVTSRYQAP